jgi:hypothetical protein
MNTIGIGSTHVTKMNQPKIVLHLGNSYSGNPPPASSVTGAEFNRLDMVRTSTKNNQIQLRNIELIND